MLLRLIIGIYVYKCFVHFALRDSTNTVRVFPFRAICSSDAEQPMAGDAHARIGRSEVHHNNDYISNMVTLT